MRFPNAHNGVKKIFTAEILSLIGTVALIIAAILALAAGTMISKGTADAEVNATVGMAAGLALFGVAGSILMLIAFIMHLISTLLSINTDSVLSEGLDLFASAVSLVVYVIYLGYLRKAKKMLEK